MADAGLANIQSRYIQPATDEARAYRPLMIGQTVCTVKDEKGKNCTGHVKQWFNPPRDVAAKAAPENTLHRCQRCFAIYEGPPQEYLHPQATK
jgi:hypothetical protein